MGRPDHIFGLSFGGIRGFIEFLKDQERFFSNRPANAIEPVGLIILLVLLLHSLVDCTCTKPRIDLEESRVLQRDSTVSMSYSGIDGAHRGCNARRTRNPQYKGTIRQLAVLVLELDVESSTQAYPSTMATRTDGSL